MIKKRNLIIIFSAASIGGILLIFWLTGLIGLWTNGMYYVVENTDKAGTLQSHVISGTYSISIDLKNLKSNIGKELYHNGKYKIYVYLVDKQDSDYRISFTSCGTYSLTNATLISGTHDITNDDHSYSTDVSAKMSAEYNGKIYHSTVSGSGPLNKDGDSFGFHIFDGEPITLHGNSIVKLTVTDLYKNIWNSSL